MLSLKEQTKRPRGNKVFDLNARMVGRDKMPDGEKLTNKISETKPCNVVKPIARRPEALRSYCKGGKIKKTGSALVHKDEFFLPVKLAKQLQKLMK